MHSEARKREQERTAAPVAEVFEYAIRLPNGSLVRDPSWRCPADVMRSTHGQGERTVGTLIRRTVVVGAWEEVAHG